MGGLALPIAGDLVRETYDQMRACFEETGLGMVKGHLLHIVNGYVYQARPRVSKREIARRQALQTGRVEASEKNGKSYFEGVLRNRIEKRLATLKRKRAAVVDFPGLVDYLEMAFEARAHVGGNLHWCQFVPGEAIGGKWQATFHELTGAPPLEANVLVQAVQNRTTRLIARLKELARIARSDRVLASLLKEGRFHDLESPRIRKRETVKRFLLRFEQMMLGYGKRTGQGSGADTSLTTPTWNMDRTRPLDIIASYAEEDLDRLDLLEKEARAERIRMSRHYRTRLAGDPEKLARFDAELEKALRWAIFLEDHNYYIEQCTGGTMREAINEVGCELVRRDIMDAPDDVLHLSIIELKKIARSKDHENQRMLVQLRKKERERRKRLKPPKRLGAKPGKAKKKNEEDTSRGLHERTIKGVGASRGRGRGRAVVVQGNKKRPHLHPGDVLVAANVGPDWTPAFAVIGGLVLDEGALMQHAAIIAREYRVPSVMQTKDATKFIQTGQTIIVDGDRGIVELGGSPA